MTGKFDVIVKVVSQKGTCATNHKVGEEWTIKGNKTPQGICLEAFQALLPNTQVLRFGGAYPWRTDPDSSTVACPDAESPVVFELRRLRQ